MIKKFYTFRAKNTGKLHYAIALNAYQAAKIIGIKIGDLRLERTEKLPKQSPLETSPSIK